MYAMQIEQLRKKKGFYYGVCHHEMYLNIGSWGESWGVEKVLLFLNFSPSLWNYSHNCLNKSDFPSADHMTSC